MPETHAACPYCQHELIHDIETDLDTCSNCGLQQYVFRPMVGFDWKQHRDNLTLIAALSMQIADELPDAAALLRPIYEYATEASEKADNILRGNDAA